MQDNLTKRHFRPWRPMIPYECCSFRPIDHDSLCNASGHISLQNLLYLKVISIVYQIIAVKKYQNVFDAVGLVSLFTLWL